MAAEKESNSLSSFTSVSPEEKFLLYLISVVFEPVSATFLHSCLGKVKSRQEGGVGMKMDTLREKLDRLRRLGMLDEKNRIPHPLVEHITRQAVEEGVFDDLVDLVERAAPVSYLYGKWSTRCWRALRQFRIGVYSGDFDKIDESQQFLEEHCRDQFSVGSAAVLVAAEAFDVQWFGSLPGSLQFYLLEKVVRYSAAHLNHYPRVIEYLEDESLLTVPLDEQVPFHRLLAGHLLIQGRFGALRRLLERHEGSFRASGFAGTLAFLEGDSARALELFNADLEQLHLFFGDDNAFFFGLPGLFCLFVLLERNDPGDRARIKAHIASALDSYKGVPEEVPYQFINAVVGSMDGVLPDMMMLTGQLIKDTGSLTRLLAVLCLYWMDVEIPDEFREFLVSIYEKGRANEFAWMTMESAFLLNELGEPGEEGGDEDYGRSAEGFRRRLGCRSIVGIIKADKSWKHSLQELISLTSTVKEQEKKSRLVWMVRFVDGTLQLTPREQKKKVSGGWSKGRVLALGRLAEQQNFDFLSGRDREICAAIRVIETPGSRNSAHSLDPEVALPALVGHPLVFLEESPQTPVEIVAGEPELLVEQQGDHLFIDFTHDIGTGNVAVWQETPTRFKVITID